MTAPTVERAAAAIVTAEYRRIRHRHNLAAQAITGILILAALTLTALVLLGAAAAAWLIQGGHP